MRLVTYS